MVKKAHYESADANVDRLQPMVKSGKVWTSIINPSLHLPSWHGIQKRTRNPETPARSVSVECILRTRTVQEFPDSLSVCVFWERNLHGIARNCKIFVSHCRAYKELHGAARNPHGICKILHSLSTRAARCKYELRMPPVARGCSYCLVTTMDASDGLSGSNFQKLWACNSWCGPFAV